MRKMRERQTNQRQRVREPRHMTIKRRAGKMLLRRAALIYAEVETRLFQRCGSGERGVRLMTSSCLRDATPADENAASDFSMRWQCVQCSECAVRSGVWSGSKYRVVVSGPARWRSICPRYSDPDPDIDRLILNDLILFIHPRRSQT